MTHRAPSAPRRTLAFAAASICALAALLALAASPAFAARGHVFGFYFGSHVNKTAEAAGRTTEEDVCPAPGHPSDECQPGEAGSGPGRLGSPNSVAVDEAAGYVYVADGSRIERFSTSGAYETEITGPNAEGEGTLTAGSKTVASVTTSSGRFVPRETITAPGIPSVEGTGDVPYEANTIENATASSGTFAVGELLEEGHGIRPGTTITALEETSPGVFKLTLSENMYCGYPSGCPGSSLHAYTTVEAVGSGTLTLSAAASASESPASLSAHRSFGTSGALDIAVDNDPGSPSYGDLYVAAAHRFTTSSAEEHVIDKFSRTGEFIYQITESSAGVPLLGTSIAVDSTGHLQVDVFPGAFHSHIVSFDNAVENGESTGDVELERSKDYGNSVHSRLAVDAEDNFYLLLNNQPQAPGPYMYIVKEFDSSGALMQGEVGGVHYVTLPAAGEEPGGILPTAVAVEPRSNDAYVATPEAVVHVSPANSLVERLGEGHLTEAEGVAADSADETVYVADGAADRVAVFTPEPPNSPVVSGATVDSVGSAAATIEAVVNPRSEAGEEPTSYRFEYGRCPSLAECSSSPYPESFPVPDGTVSPDFELHRVAADLEGLLPHADYHFRVTAENEHGSASGEELTFTTFSPALAFSLPDQRGWELVTPPNKHGAAIIPVGGGVSQAAASGGALAYVASGPTETQPQGNRQFAAQAIARRGEDGWTSQELAEPVTRSTVFQQGYPLFSSDLSLGLALPTPPSTLLTSEASAWTPYLRRTFVSSTEVCPSEPSACWVPLVTSKQGYADLPPGAEFTTETDRPTVEGATADLSHVVLSISVFSEPSLSGLYEWSAAPPWQARLQRVGVLPAGEGGQPVDCRTGGYARLANGPAYGAGHGISADGSRLFFEVVRFGGGSSCPSTGLQHHLYLRDLAKGETLRLDTVQPGAEESEREAEEPDPTFEAASADGSVVFFTDSQRLTAASGEGDLYECRIEANASGEPACALTDLTPLGKDGRLGLWGTVFGAAEDASHLYFAAAADLTGSEENANGETAVEGQPNLYVLGGGTTRFIAALSPGGDEPDWNSGTLVGHSYPGVPKVSRVSPDGRWLEFMSRRPLTGYDNRDAASGEPDEEVYLYDAAADGGEGSLVCASCSPTGARPSGEFLGADRARAAVNDYRNGFWEYRWLAATVPSMRAASETITNPSGQPRYLSNSGRLFFDAHGPLVPQDTNGQWDVYQWEPPGAGGCTASASTYSERSGGCVSLISSGASNHESTFLEASESGNDVFFLTTSRLLGRDYDTSYDIYDARVGGGFPEEEPPAPCEGGESCHGEGTHAPGAATPASSTVHSHGNLHLGCSVFAQRTRKLAHAAKRLRHKARLLRRRGRRLAHARDRRHRRLARRYLRRSHRFAKAAKRRAKLARRLARRTKACRRTNGRTAR